jgi:hypothetical protein
VPILGSLDVLKFKKSSSLKVAEMAAGMMSQFSLEKINIPALLACIGDEDKALLVADEGI